MFPIHIPTPDVEPDLRLILVLYSLSPAALASWLQDRLLRIDQRIWIGWYGVVLAGVASVDAAILGSTIGFTQAAPIGTSIGIGFLLGGIAIVTDFNVRRVAAWLGKRRGARASSIERPGVPRPIVPADVPWVAVSYKASDPPAYSRNRLPALLVGAVLEEYIYRQALLELLAPVFPSIAWPVFISTLFFGLTHFQFGAAGVISKWVIGAVFIAAVLAGGGLLSVIIGHLVLNTAAYISMQATLERSAVAPLRVASARH